MSAFAALAAVVALPAVVALAAVVALSAVLAFGTAASFASFTCVPVIPFFLIRSPGIEFFLMSLPLSFVTA